MCAACDSAEAAVEEAVAGEAVPLVCSVPECAVAPVVRVSVSLDNVQIVCAEHLVNMAVSETVAALTNAAAEAGFVSRDQQLHMSAAISMRLEDQLEVLA